MSDSSFSHSHLRAHSSAAAGKNYGSGYDWYKAQLLELLGPLATTTGKARVMAQIVQINQAQHTVTAQTQDGNRVTMKFGQSDPLPPEGLRIEIALSKGGQSRNVNFRAELPQATAKSEQPAPLPPAPAEQAATAIKPPAPPLVSRETATQAQESRPSPIATPTPQASAAQQAATQLAPTSAPQAQPASSIMQPAPPQPINPTPPQKGTVTIITPLQTQPLKDEAVQAPLPSSQSAAPTQQISPTQALQPPQPIQIQDISFLSRPQEAASPSAAAAPSQNSGVLQAPQSAENMTAPIQAQITGHIVGHTESGEAIIAVQSASTAAPAPQSTALPTVSPTISPEDVPAARLFPLPYSEDALPVGTAITFTQIKAPLENLPQSINTTPQPQAQPQQPSATTPPTTAHILPQSDAPAVLSAAKPPASQAQAQAQETAALADNAAKQTPNVQQVSKDSEAPPPLISPSATAAASNNTVSDSKAQTQPIPEALAAPVTLQTQKSDANATTAQTATHVATPATTTPPTTTGPIAPQDLAVPLPITPLPLAPQSGPWPALEELSHTLQQLAPQTFSTLQAMAPNISQPSIQMAPAVLFFIAASHAGDLAGWLGDKTVETLRKAGKDHLLDKIAQDLGVKGGSSKSTSDSPAQTGASHQDWRSMPLPLFAYDSPHKMMLHYRYDARDQEGEESDPARKIMRFVLDLKLDRMGAVQLDGFAQSGRLDLVVRTQANLSPAMRHIMRQKYTNALGATGYDGELGFQGSPGQFVTINTPESHAMMDV